MVRKVRIDSNTVYKTDIRLVHDTQFQPTIIDLCASAPTVNNEDKWRN